MLLGSFRFVGLLQQLQLIAVAGHAPERGPMDNVTRRVKLAALVVAEQRDQRGERVLELGSRRVEVGLGVEPQPSLADGVVTPVALAEKDILVGIRGGGEPDLGDKLRGQWFMVHGVGFLSGWLLLVNFALFEADEIFVKVFSVHELLFGFILGVSFDLIQTGFFDDVGLHGYVSFLG
jgi:hypothetical protein